VDDKKVNREHQYENGHIILNLRSILSFYFHNSSVEFLRRKVHAVAHTLGVTTSIHILQNCDEDPICITNLLINEFD
jgi:hypothetical protein